MSNTLIRETLIASSDEDMERLHASIVAGFDPDRNFVILMEKVQILSWMKETVWLSGS